MNIFEFWRDLFVCFDCLFVILLRKARRRRPNPEIRAFLERVHRIDNLQNYCLGTRYGARSRSRLCRRLSISLVRYRHGLEKFLEHHFIPIRGRFNPHDLPTRSSASSRPTFFGEERPIFSTGNVDGMAWLVLVRSFIAYLKL